MNRLEEFFRRAQAAQAAVDAVIGEHVSQVQTLVGNQAAVDLIERTRVEIVAALRAPNDGTTHVIDQLCNAAGQQLAGLGAPLGAGLSIQVARDGGVSVLYCEPVIVAKPIKEVEAS